MTFEIIQEEHTATLVFLGNREYIQSSTLFEAVVSFVPSNSSVSFKVSKIITVDVIKIVLLSEYDESVFKNCEAVLEWQNDEAKGYVVVQEQHLSSNNKRVPYNESEVLKDLAVHESSIECKHNLNYSLMATVVALNKLLLSKVISEGKGKWLFSRIDLLVVPENTKNVELKLVNTLGNGRIVKSSIIVNKENIGYVWFNLV